MINLAAMKVYWNGEVMSENEVTVSPWDLGLLRGYAVFEYISIYQGSPFMLDLHLERLKGSAKMIDLELPTAASEFVNVVQHLIKENRVIDGAVRIIVTGGVSRDGASRGDRPTVLIRTENPGKLSPELYKNGAKLISIEYEREIPLAKTTQYVEALRHEKAMRELGAVEILFSKDGIISECSRSNIFVALDGKLVTPREGALLGVTRSVVLEIAQQLGIPTEVADVSFDQLINADEVFITGTGKKVLPIIKVDEYEISNSRPGEVTEKIIEAYEKRTRV